jgi:HPt (histidine-containing phosphotransfer) domain-containing protein
MNVYVSKLIGARNLLTRLVRLPARVPAVIRDQAVVKTAPNQNCQQENNVIDEEKLRDLLQYLPVSGVIDLVSLFTAESNGHAIRIKNYLSEKDYSSIAREAHILVSTAGNIGAMTLSGTARAVEHACKNGQMDDFGRLIGELDRGISAANAAFSAWIAAQEVNTQKDVRSPRQAEG